ncbi:MAG: ribosome biogenesis GTPase Der [Deltaproteobacteria bacterium]|nr:ribosome biogenesis GTPase Der [Deltaproteobacteria bacterium]
MSHRRGGGREERGEGLPVLSLVGRPNVGKSSLFNRLVGGRPALVEDLPGVTRDRRYGVCLWGKTRLRVVDTGGLDPKASGILAAMRGQTLRAVDEADVLVLVLDAAEGVTAVDEDVAEVLRRTGKPVLVAVNKVDSELRESALAEGYRLGFPQVFGVSATHGRGVSELLDAAVAALAAPAATSDFGDAILRGPGESDAAAEPEPPIRLAFVGKPNAGKSSLVNRLLGEERVLVHDQPGTTRDPIDTPFRAGGREFVLVDTAGLRRRRSIDTLTEAVAAKMARDQLARADVVALVVDASLGATAEDAKLAGFIEESGRGCLVILNKMDLVRRAESDRRIAAAREVLDFVGYAPFLPMSAVTGRGVASIPDLTARVFFQWSRRVATSELNKHFEEMVTRRLPPSGPAGKHVKLYFVTQADIRPPTFFVSTNLPNAVGQPYRRYLANQLRKIYGFEGSPLRLALRAHRSKRKAAPLGR